MIDIGKALSFPTRSSNWKSKIIIGTVLTLVPIINFSSLGYIYKIYKAVLNREKLELPEWGDWRHLFLVGLRLAIIAFIYFIIPFVITAMGAGIIVFSSVIDPAAGSIGISIFIAGCALALFGLFLWLAVSLALPMALAHYAKSEEKFRSIFKLGDIMASIAKARDYMLAFVIVLGVMIILFIIVVTFIALIQSVGLFFIFTAFLPIAGPLFIFTASLLFYMSLFSCALLGMACSDAYAAAPAPRSAEAKPKPKGPEEAPGRVTRGRKS